MKSSVALRASPASSLMTTADAGCTYQTWCDHCGGSYDKRIFFSSD